MPLNFAVPSPLQYFASLVQSDAHFPLLETAICLAQDEYPDLDVEQILGDVDQLLVRLKRRVPSDAPELQRLRALNQFFFRAVVWLELAVGLGLNARGVAFPGHFMVKVNLPKGQVVIDPFSGQSLSREELAERLEPFRLQGLVGEEFEVPMGLYLQSASSREIISRMLRNLQEIHKGQEDWTRLIAVQDRLIVLEPEAWADYRDRGLARATLGDNMAAVADLQIYLAHAENAFDTEVIAERIAQLRRADQ